MSKQKLIVLTGPTAVGKSKLSIELAKRIGGEIISADSMQVYKYMDIGTDKISTEKMEGVPHHLIDILDPSENFNVFLFQKLVKEAICDISGRGKIPIIVGGTGFYIQAVLYDIDFTETDEDTSIRNELEERAKNGETEALFNELKEIDPKSADIIHANNVKRVIRALEYYKKTGRPISEHNEEQHQRTSPYDFKYFVLTDDREVLYSRIDKRVDLMIEEGLEEEVRKLLEMNIDRSATSMQGLGYREMLGYLDGEYDLERAVYLIKRNTRHFAKRQLTWFRREKDVRWIDKREFGRDDERILEEMIRIYKDE
ncbi:MULTISPECIES: tRNA (adenosine(37)-N6)-dimethylallyltransferase MiaA [unclassified Butyrivibrio]|uniref:tRNA (adenosine(37)-N6)-dimethylallyltransferase MiaA n=1 Tax=unclassified Butyrivibrio TaxID=2639466 RepID=UPI0008E84ADA|nr:MULTISPECIES: tRNA (adenosine(37)-N6)-dimethylallyltransferase MiaA [unclassified Butyrivibrio]RKM62609.1 tRNA (adenosine(37)-N6)-dimethylallyltransferase MiaA [Butyrivibrio sp. XB500-5]SFU80946.1 tRNA dimethylallyltransferase [Butyrivibrio sp. INlla21]